MTDESGLHRFLGKAIEKGLLADADPAEREVRLQKAKDYYQKSQHRSSSPSSSVSAHGGSKQLIPKTESAYAFRPMTDQVSRTLQTWATTMLLRFAGSAISHLQFTMSSSEQLFSKLMHTVAIVIWSGVPYVLFAFYGLFQRK
eukprot:ANDGO_03031.mRNA.1 hypothetical protein